MNPPLKPFYIDNPVLTRAAKYVFARMFVDSHAHQLDQPAAQHSIYKLATAQARVRVRMGTTCIYVELYTKTLPSTSKTLFTYFGSIRLGNYSTDIYTKHLHPYIVYIAKTITSTVLNNIQHDIEKSINKSINYTLNDKGKPIQVIN